MEIVHERKMDVNLWWTAMANPLPLGPDLSSKMAFPELKEYFQTTLS